MTVMVMSKVVSVKSRVEVLLETVSVRSVVTVLSGGSLSQVSGHTQVRGSFNRVSCYHH